METLDSVAPEQVMVCVWPTGSRISAKTDLFRGITDQNDSRAAEDPTDDEADHPQR